MNLAYCAGFFDGEGCINFTRCRSTIYPRILLVNTNRELLEQFQARFGGDINPLALRKINWKQGWAWRLSWTRAVDFLEAIYPWIELKQMQIQTVFAWDAIRPGRGQRSDQQHREAVDLLIRRMKWLNNKGPNNEPDPIDQVLEEDSTC